MRKYLDRLRTGQHRDTNVGGQRWVPYGATICPNCGSKSTSVIKTPKPQKGHAQQRTHKCCGCGITFHSTEGKKELPPPRGSAFPVVMFVRTRCPSCGSSETPIDHTERLDRATIARHHTCSGCKTKFKSEQLLTKADLTDPGLPAIGCAQDADGRQTEKKVEAGSDADAESASGNSDLGQSGSGQDNDRQSE